ncbi:MAG: hypothetical protein II768_11655 [Clostridia bacterium]|nr:hypothetical protein [Clostridia bacterium]
MSYSVLLFDFTNLFNVEYVRKELASFCFKHLTPICGWLTALFRYLDPTVGEFYRGPLWGLKYFLTFLVIAFFAILLWVRSFKRFMKNGGCVDVKNSFQAFLFCFSRFVRIVSAVGLVQFALELTIAHYGERIVNNECYMDAVDGMTIFDAATWPYWADLIVVIILLRLALTLFFGIVLGKPLSIFSLVVHSAFFLSVGWLFGNLVYVLDLIYQNMTLATSLFGLLAWGLSSAIRVAIPIMTDIMLIIVYGSIGLLMLSPFIVLLGKILGLFIGDGPSASSSGSGGKKMVTTSTIRNGVEVFSETHEASLLDVFDMSGNFWENLFWFIG